ncbi:MAG: HIT domain-containing protein [Ignavibacteriaceae bacterium]|jgi:ATP adenylyltransferase
MEKLWSPWRSKYIESLSNKNDDDECIFCEAAKNDVNDPENLLVRKGELTFTLLNLYPYNNGHLMIIPFRHIGDLDDLSDKEGHEIIKELQIARRSLKVISQPHGFNIGANIGRAGGAGIDEHIHFHIVPRWSGDTNFMPVLGEVKVISQELKETKLKLLNAYKKLK